MVKIEDCKAMTDHFDGIDKLVKEAPHTEGAPNFRRVSYFRTTEMSLLITSNKGVNFTNILQAAFLYVSAFRSLQYGFVIFLAKGNQCKSCLQNVGKINYRFPPLFAGVKFQVL